MWGCVGGCEMWCGVCVWGGGQLWSESVGAPIRGVFNMFVCMSKLLSHFDRLHYLKF